MARDYSSYIKGYVTIRVEGFFIERFINTCNIRKIQLWNLKRETTTVLYASISVEDFKRIREIAKKTKSRIKVIDKKGLAFVAKRYKKRRVFVLLCMCLVMGIIVLSNFVWNIEIEGVQTIEKEEIQKNLQEEGLEIGMWKNHIQTRDIINRIRLKRDDIAWIGIEIQGTNAIVKIVEADAKPEIIDEEEYCDIVASKDAVIVSIEAQNGIPTVKAGDLVKAGSILISGTIEGKYTGIRNVHAEGSVKAKVWYTEKVKTDLKEHKMEKNGNREKRYGIKLNNFQINLFKTLSKFEKYDTIRENKKLKLFSNFYLPIELITITNYELQEREYQYSLEEAKQKGIKEAQEVLDKTIQQEKRVTEEQKILNKYITANENEEYVEVEVTYEVLEEIGTKEKIVF